MSSSGSLAIIAGSGAAAAGTTSKLRIADASLIGSGMSDSGTDINFLLAAGQAAVVNSAGVAGLVGAAVWSLGDTILGGLHFFVEWSARQNSTVIVVGFKRASSAPTALTDLQVDSVWLQMNINASGKVDCYHKKEADTLTAQHINYDDLASAKAVIYQVAAGPL